MDKIETSENEQEFLSNPKIVQNYSLLREIGVFKYIDSLNQEIRNYKNLFSGALEIFNRTSVDEIMDVTVWQISDHFLPSFIVFLWKPLQNKEDLVIRSYQNYKKVDMNLNLETISPFEPFFKKYPRPINYDLLSFEMDDAGAVKALDKSHPELVIPILGPSGLYGLVLVGRKILEDEYNTAELVYLQNLMAFVSQAVQNHLHYERTLRDVKTGLFNNGFFMTRLSEELARAKRIGSCASIIIMDVDKFKNFNDTYGHLAGDRVLETLALTIKQTVRTEDVPSRFGGEEFTVLMPDTDKRAVWVAAERLRTAVESMKTDWDPPLPQVTISLGVFTFNQDTNLPAAGILRCADEALYLSKGRGRNCTTAWGSGLLAKIRRMIPEPEIIEPISKPG
ncbi:MAG: sensor domain-containing diguanylate cyclase [Treponema sp.]|jgi:diguanylate cyclase (GGDEF)-like protein|nr:sensor domain-containing diguanylate cyclase [Treponema sp.]